MSQDERFYGAHVCRASAHVWDVAPAGGIGQPDGGDEPVVSKCARCGVLRIYWGADMGGAVTFRYPEVQL